MRRLKSLIRRRLVRIWKVLRYQMMQEGWRVYVRLDDGGWRHLELKGEMRKYRNFCADPFLFRHEGFNYLFCETMGQEGKGTIACFKEIDDRWVQQGIVLEEPWHLSYPQVFEENGGIYMLPESSVRGMGNVALYESVEFPLKWRRVAILIDRPFADATLVKQDGYWYAACYNIPPNESAEIWMAESLAGPWHRHTQWSAINQSKRLRRCGGRFLRENGRIFRIAQDCNGFYGKRLFRIPILEMSPDVYREGPAELFMDKTVEPLGMKHTYNRLDYDGHTLSTVDVHWDVRRPITQIIANFIDIFCSKMKSFIIKIFDLLDEGYS